MRIAIFTDTFLPKIDGVATSLVNLSCGLADRGHKVFIICPYYKNISKEFCHKNVEVIRVRGVPALFYPEFKLTNFFSYKIFRRLKREKIDLIHFETPFTLGFQGILISKILSVPLVGTFHTFFGDPDYLRHVGMNYKAVSSAAWMYSGSFYNRCDLITCPSQSTKDELILHNHFRRIKVISNGIDSKVFDNRNFKKMKSQYNPNGPLLLFIGRIAHEKNIFFLLHSFKLVIKKIPNARLLLIGDGPQMNEVKETAKSLNLENNTIILGKVDHEKLIKSGIFKACDLFVSASLTENQPMTILESQANGLPCVVINARGMKDLVLNNYNGFLVPNNQEKFSEAIIKLISNKKLLEKFKKNTLKEIKKHELSYVISEWEKEYSQLIQMKK